MATHVPMARLPFAPLDNPRLQHLASAKNRQNGVISQKGSITGKPMGGASKFNFSMPTTTATKRAYEPTSIFDDIDSENIDPSVFDSPSKKTKTFSFDLKSAPMATTTTRSFLTPSKPNMSSPRTPLTAPAGRSPPRKHTSIFGNNKSRRVSAPFTRIDPPSVLSNRNNTTSTLPFSLDAALSGTFSSPTTSTEPPTTLPLPTTSMPKSWFFTIHEDTPDEEASNLMEHSTLVLDLSSDDDEETITSTSPASRLQQSPCSPSRRGKDDKGKENTPPEGYDAVSASRARALPPPPSAPASALASETSAEPTATSPAETATAFEPVRKIVGEVMCDGLRTPLADLEREPFFADGLDGSEVVVVGAAEENVSVEVLLGAAPVEFVAGGKKTEEMKVVEEVKVVEDVKMVKEEVQKVAEEFAVWEDEVDVIA